MVEERTRLMMIDEGELKNGRKQLTSNQFFRQNLSFKT